MMKGIDSLISELKLKATIFSLFENWFYSNELNLNRNKCVSIIFSVKHDLIADFDNTVNLTKYVWRYLFKVNLHGQ